jgi:hypothetical protein
MDEVIDEHSSQKLLSEPKHIRQDLKHMELVIRANPIEIPQAIIEAMPKVTGTIMVKGKPREQLAAGRLLLAMMEYNQRLKEAEKPRTPTGTTINVGVNVDASTDQRRNRTLAIAQRFGAGGVLSDASAGSGGSDNGSDCVRVATVR